MVRRDCDGHGGGVCMLILSQLSFIVHELPATFFETEICVLDVSCNQSLYRFFVVYRPPSSDVFHSNLLLSALDHFCNVAYPVVLCGDFNLPLIDWTNNTAPNDFCNMPFLEMTWRNSLCQLIDVPTRGNAILDLLLTNANNILGDVHVDTPFSTSNHNSISFSLFVDLMSNHMPVINSLFDYRSMNVEDIEDFLFFFSWPDAFNVCVTTHDFWNVFKDTLYLMFDAFVPQWPQSRSRCPAMPRHLQRLSHKKRQTWK